MTTEPVAMGLVSDARSKSVSTGVAIASCQSRPALLPTSTVAVGKTPAATARSRTSRAAVIADRLVGVEQLPQPGFGVLANGVAHEVVRLAQPRVCLRVREPGLLHHD